MADFVKRGSVQFVKRGSCQLKLAAQEVRAAVRARHIVAGLVAVGFALCGAVEVSSSVALLANQKDNHAIIDTSWHCDMLVNITSRNRTEDFEIIFMELPQEERAESIMREAFLWGQVAGPILGGCLVWGRSGPSMVFSRAVLSACLASLLVPAAWRGPSHVALRLFQGLCTALRNDGATMPAAHMFAMTWFKSNHRSWYFSCYAAVSVGYCLTGWLGTAVVRTFGRDSLCYGLVLLALCWYFAFGRFVKDTPKSYQHDTTAAVIPWGKLLRSVPVWASAVATMGNQWGDATLALGMTKYLKLIYGFSTANVNRYYGDSCELVGIAGSWRLVFGVASVVLLTTAAVFLALGKGVPQPWIPSVARPRSHDVIYEQDALELDHEDVGVQTEPFVPYSLEDDIESLKNVPRSSSIHSKISVASN
ncbi:Sialin [Trachymyrmex cornetzi]|uniref:Sialin n=1 Tax=Trachymyrmex cornetzi TaxID=471704 RepID=A0A195E7A0_9HYME|nr:Sialin [Trachymyrmex cornetzi]